MFTTRQTIIGGLFASFLFIALGVPSTALAGELEKASIRMQFQSSLSQSQRVTFTDDKYATFANDNLDGYIATNDEYGLFVLEGDERIVEDAIDNLQADSRLASVTVLDRSYPSSATHSSLASHTELDPRNNADAQVKSSTVKKVRVRATYASSLSVSERIGWHDDYFKEFAADGLGGLFVNGHGGDFITIEIEGPAVRVDYWVDQLKTDDKLASVTVLASEYNSQTTITELVGHLWKDARDSN